MKAVSMRAFFVGPVFQHHRRAFNRDRNETTSLAAEHWVIVPTVLSV